MKVKKKYRFYTISIIMLLIICIGMSNIKNAEAQYGSSLNGKWKGPNGCCAIISVRAPTFNIDMSIYNHPDAGGWVSENNLHFFRVWGLEGVTSGTYIPPYTIKWSDGSFWYKVTPFAGNTMNPSEVNKVQK